jgi:hypothetical protein
VTRELLFAKSSVLPAAISNFKFQINSQHSNLKSEI